MRAPEQRRNIKDVDLAKKLAELRGELDPDNKAGPNVIVIWEAIERITTRNKECMERGQEPYPMPEWVNVYLLRSAEKIGRLWLGVKPEDDRPLLDIMNSNEIGALRKTLQFEGKNSDGSKAEKLRDRRVDYVAKALGFVRRGSSAFQRQDRAERDSQYLKVRGDLDLIEDPVSRKKAQQCLSGIIKKNEGISSEQAIRNRLSEARRAAKNRAQT